MCVCLKYSISQTVWYDSDQSVLASKLPGLNTALHDHGEVLHRFLS